MKETEIAKYFIDYLSDYDLYFEIPRFNVDIVAKSGNIIMAFEVKTSLNFKVIEQAERNCHWFHYSYICVPHSHSMDFAAKICQHFGIGILTYSQYQYRKIDEVREYLKPKLNRIALRNVSYIKLPEYSKRSIAGATGGDGTTITAFKVTVSNIVNYLKHHNGASLKDVYENVETHYYSMSATRSCLYQWIHKGVIKEFYIENSRLYLTKNQ